MFQIYKKYGDIYIYIIYLSPKSKNHELLHSSPHFTLKLQGPNTAPSGCKVGIDPIWALSIPNNEKNMDVLFRANWKL